MHQVPGKLCAAIRSLDISRFYIVSRFRASSKSMLLRCPAFPTASRLCALTRIIDAITFRTDRRIRTTVYLHMLVLERQRIAAQLLMFSKSPKKARAVSGSSEW